MEQLKTLISEESQVGCQWRELSDARDGVDIGGQIFGGSSLIPLQHL